MSLCPARVEAPKRIELPRTSTRLQIPNVYVKIIETIRPEPFGCAAFESRRLYRPGALVETADLPHPCVAIECTGPIGVWQRGKKRESGYILWRFDFGRFEWAEICRAQALDASWTIVFREPAMRALYPRPELVDVVGRSHDLADELVEAIDRKLLAEMLEIRMSALNRIYERVAGRIAECA